MSGTVKYCKRCGAEFVQRPSTFQIFCSRICKKQYQNEQARRPKVERECVQCGKIFITSSPQTMTCSKYCSKMHTYKLIKESRMDYAEPSGHAIFNPDWGRL